MIWDRLLAIVEIALLVRILWQGEFIVRYEKGTYELHAERDRERRDWREAKRKAAVKKIENGNGTVKESGNEKEKTT